MIAPLEDEHDAGAGRKPFSVRLDSSRHV